MALLYDAYNRPVRTQELTREHAAPTMAGVRSIWNDSVATGLTPTSLAGLLRQAAEGDHDSYLTLAEEMEERDLHYAAELSKRKLAVGRLPVTVESASDDQRDIDIADAVRRLVKGSGFRFMLKDLLDGLGKGFSVCEINWNRSLPQWKPLGYDWRDPHFFQFDRIRRTEIRLKDETGGMDGLPLAPFKFITHVPKIKSGIPIRGGLARLATWAYMCKNYSIKDWLAFAEVYGMPMRMGKYGPNASDADKDVLRMAVANLGTDAAAIFPESMQIELVEAGGKNASADFFQRLADYFDSQVSKGILGQTASASGTPGKLGDEKLQAEVRDDIRDDDAAQLEATLQRDLVQPFVDLNFGTRDDYPQIQMRAADAYDIASMSEALSLLVPLGLRVEQSVVRDRMGLPDPDKNAKPEDLLQQVPVPPSPPALNLAMNREASGDDEQAAIDAAGDGLTAAELQQQMEGVLAPMMKLIDEAGSFEDILAALAEAEPDVPIEDLQEKIARAIFVGEMYGRVTATEAPSA